MKKLLYSIVSVVLATMLSVFAFAAVPGDVSGDGNVTILDVLIMVKAVANKKTIDNADLNGDGKVTILDVVKALKIIATGDTPVVGESDKSSASVTVENGTVKEAVSINGETVSAAVPEGVAVADGTSELTLTVTALESTGGNVTTTEDEDAISYDVHIDGVAEDNNVAIVVDLGAILPAGQNFGTVALYHIENGETVKMTQVMTLGELDEHNEFYYYPATGNVYVAMATFSEIMIVNDTVNAWKGEFDYTWYENPVTTKAGEIIYTVANADQFVAFGAIVGGMAKDKNGNYVYTDPSDAYDHSDNFNGKTVRLVANINIGDLDGDNGYSYYPVGYYNTDETYDRSKIGDDGVTSGFYNFEGTFDGMGHTIANIYQNTWEMIGDHNWYSAKEAYYRDGMGLFGKVYGGTVKNLTVENFSSDGEITTTGTIAAYADCGATFENITIVKCNPRVYNIGNGGIVGCVGWYSKKVVTTPVTFKNITVDNTNKISALWGSYDVACGGILGQYYPTSGQSSAGYPKNPGVHFENCHVAAQIDVFNDVCANYQYYAYRYAGILLGSVKENVTIGGHVYPKMDGITAKDCTVHFGDWNDYYYCEIIDNTTASYTHDYQMSRLEQVKKVNGTTITYLDGTTGTVPTSGRANYVVVNKIGDDGKFVHATENATCYHFKDGAVWTHDMSGFDEGIDENGDGKDDLKEDKQHIYLEFNNLVTGDGWGVTTKAVGEMEGVTILDRKVGESVVKFETKYKDFEAYLYHVGNVNEVSLGTLFEVAADLPKNMSIRDSSVYVTVDRVFDKETVSGTFTANTSDWTKGTIQFSGTGLVTITIQDYEYCAPTTISVYIVDATNVTNANVSADVLNNVAVLENIKADCTITYTGNVYGNNFSYTTGTVYIGNGTVDDLVFSE